MSRNHVSSVDKSQVMKQQWSNGVTEEMHDRTQLMRRDDGGDETYIREI